MQKNTNFVEEKRFKVIDYTGLILIGLFSLGYCLFVRRFAELHISFPFLNFPIFIGEILLFFCLILFLTKFKLNNKKLKWWHYLLFCWISFILLKSLFGYLKWGPLALRHSALFYYPMFAIVGFAFYREEFFKNKMLVFLLLMLIACFHFIVFHWYTLMTCSILCIVLLRGYMPRSTRILLFILFFLFLPYKLFLYTSRTFLISNIITLLFITIAMFFILKVELYYKAILTVFIIAFVSLGIFIFGDKVNIASFQKFKKFEEIKEAYNEYNKIILNKKNDYNEDLKKAKLYNPEVHSVQYNVAKLIGDVQRVQSVIAQIKSGSELISEVDNLSMEEIQIKTGSELIPKVDNLLMEEVLLLELELGSLQEKLTKGEVDHKVAQKKVDESSSRLETLITRLDNSNIEMGERIFKKKVEGDINDMFFRLFIWRDMLSKFKGGNIFFGRDFGEPFRSISLEILYWADSEWRRDGWITAHNSYFEIIYRTGIVGFLYILGISVIFLRMVKRSLELKSVTGVLLSGILINWLVAANALVLFELPYNAIPFWSLFGMVFAYLFKPKLI